MTPPEIGTKMFFVQEHIHYITGHAAPVKEYCVCEGEITRILDGKYPEIRLLGKNPNGWLQPNYFKLSEIGKKVFFSFKGASDLAKKKNIIEQAWNTRIAYMKGNQLGRKSVENAI